MTDRVNSFLVILEHDIREDDINDLAKTLQSIRGVLSVRSIVNTGQAELEKLVATERIKHELIMKLAEVIDKLSSQ
jgi:hypothetical protein